VAEFQTGWFVESLLTELVVALIVRTARPCVRSRPGRLLLYSTIGVAVAACVAPIIPGAALLGFVPLRAPVLATLVGVTAAYAVTVELFKANFYRHRRSVSP
jgi:Mg2+-importing ATPase